MLEESFTKVMVCPLYIHVHGVLMKDPPCISPLLWFGCSLMKECPNCGTQAHEKWIICPSCQMDMQKAAEILGRDYYIPQELEPVFANPTAPFHCRGQQPNHGPQWPHPPPVATYPTNLLLIVLLIVTIPTAIIWPPIAWICVVLSGIAVHIDAKELHVGNSQKETFGSVTWSPFSWALLVFLLWIVGMPLYMCRRRQIWEQSLE